MQDFAQTYRAASDDEIARLHGQVDSLTNDARLALLSEIQRRGLSDLALSGLRDEQTEHAASVKTEWQESRKADASKTLTRIAIRVAAVVAAGIIAAVIAVLNSKH